MEKDGFQYMDKNELKITTLASVSVIATPADWILPIKIFKTVKVNNHIKNYVNLLTPINESQLWRPQPARHACPRRSHSLRHRHRRALHTRRRYLCQGNRSGTR